jgi:hypothetical protein
VAKLGMITLKGASGTPWTFEVYPRDTAFRAVGAVYVQSARTRNANGAETTDSSMWVRPAICRIGRSITIRRHALTGTARMPC